MSRASCASTTSTQRDEGNEAMARADLLLALVQSGAGGEDLAFRRGSSPNRLCDAVNIRVRPSRPSREVDSGSRPTPGEGVVEPDLLGLDVGEDGFEDGSEVVVGCIVGPHGERATGGEMSGSGV
jgi:hypothetical protein